MSFIRADGSADRGRNDSRQGAGYNRGMVSLRRIGGRMVIAAAVGVGFGVGGGPHGAGGATPLTLSTPAPGGAVTITVDVVLADGPRRIVKTASPGGGAVVEVRLGE